MDTCAPRSWVGPTQREQVAIIGVKSFQHKKEWDFAKQNRIHVFTARNLNEKGMAKIYREAPGYVMDEAETIYVSLDIDVLNRTLAPGTGNVMGMVRIVTRPEDGGCADPTRLPGGHH